MVRFATLRALVAAPLASRQAAAPWDWQLQPPLDLTARVSTLGLDPDGVTASAIAAQHARGVTTICQVSIGTLEDWRADVAAFPPPVVGRACDTWPGERFLDIRRQHILLPRMARCAAMGFDANERDNMDVHINDSGFDISGQDIVASVRALAQIAHGLGLRFGQKKVPDLTARLAADVDFIITENCITDGWYAHVDRYAASGQTILAAEHDVAPAEEADFRAAARTAGLSIIFKTHALDCTGTRCGP